MKQLKGSYTVEAAFIMTMVLWAMTVFIQYAYSRCRQATGILRTHAAVEALRHREEEKQIRVDSKAYEIQIEKKEKKVVGQVSGKNWTMTIESKLFEPEEFLRLLTMMPEQGEKEGEVK